MNGTDAATEDIGLQRVRDFWDTEACGTHFVRDYSNDSEFFARYRQFRYRTEWHIPDFASFAAASGTDLLEVGCGNGAEGVMFAKHGANYTGVDLTEEAIDATRRHFRAENLRGTFHRENAEKLSFEDDSFDIVYSFGVLHHTPHPQLAVDEVHRVLRPGGTARVMLYHRNSFNYHARILGYMRLRLLLRILGRLGRWRSDARRLADASPTGVRGNEASAIWAIHYRHFLREGWRYLRAHRFVHHCTDGPECPYAFTYTRKTATELFSRFRTVELSVGHLPLNKYPGGKYLPAWVERLLASRLGWHLLIIAVK